MILATLRALHERAVAPQRRIKKLEMALEAIQWVINDRPYFSRHANASLDQIQTVIREAFRG